MHHVEIQVRRWFQKTYGNTYFSGEIYVDDKLVAKIKEQYGYGEHGAYELLDLAISKNALPQRNTRTESLANYFSNNNMTKLVNFVDVKLKREL